MALQRIGSTSLWGVWKIEESSEDLLAVLNEKEWYLPFLEKIKLESRKEEWLAVRVLLKTLLKEEKQIDYHINGAPFLVEAQQSISFSHTKGCVAVQVLPVEHAGIDIEYLSDRVLKIKNRFLSLKELAGIDANETVVHLLLHWSAKETIFKALMQQDVDFREQLHIEPFKLEREGFIAAYETRTELRQSFKLGYLVTDEYVLTYIIN